MTRELQERKETMYLLIVLCVHFANYWDKVGTPEYGQGITFKDYITYELNKPNTSNRATYLNNVLKTNLERQVRSRYFVTAYNSSRIHFLYPAALDFLNNLRTVKTLNRLEQYVLTKLQDKVMLHNIKIDGFFFYRVYADLTTLVKSNKLSKSVFDMNVHYLELLDFLQEVILCPDQLIDNSTPVFISEPRLYTDTALIIRSKNSHIHNNIFSKDGIDKDTLLPRIKVATECMAKKLSDYKKDQLPGGKYWTPTAEEKEILQKLAPNNDVCESILGLNDWITTHTPNLCQVTKSTLVEVKKIKKI